MEHVGEVGAEVTELGEHLGAEGRPDVGLAAEVASVRVPAKTLIHRALEDLNSGASSVVTATSRH